MLRSPWFASVIGALVMWGASIFVPTWLAMLLAVPFLVWAVLSGITYVPAPPTEMDHDTSYMHLMIMHKPEGATKFVWTFRDWVGLVLLLIVAYAVVSNVDPITLLDKIIEVVREISA